MHNLYYTPVDITTRPVDADTFEVFIVKYERATKSVILDFQDGRPNRPSKRFWAGASLLTELMLNPTFREHYLSYLNKGFCLNLSCFKTEEHVGTVLDDLLKQGVTYMYLRGSEVSLDRMVQLQD